MTLQELEQKYQQIPLEIKQTRRWICYNSDKIPMNPMTGSCASSTNPVSWSTFKVAVLGCVKYHFAGIGFVLGEDKTTGTSYFGVDLDNHPDKVTGLKAMTEEEFLNFSSEFVNALSSYTEKSHSGEGIHIICKGKLPGPACRRNSVPVEMYDNGRYFTMTGNVISNLPINDRTEEIKPLWEKYLNVKSEQSISVQTGIILKDDGGVKFGGADRIEATTYEISSSHLSDSELIEKIKSSQSGSDFISLFNGDMSQYGNDHSAADLAFCKILAFWTGCDATQTDRIFRSSGLMREKWNRRRGDETYGSLTIRKAFESQRDFYTPAKEKIVVPNIITKQVPIEQQDIEQVQFDERNDPIVQIKQIFKHYPLTDTGNAERFYDYFGQNFRYNTDNKFFLFWNGKTWLRDDRLYVRKYANEMIGVLKDEAKQTEKEIEQLINSYKETEVEKANAAIKASELKSILKMQERNIDRVSNKAGKDAMISELQSLHELPVKNSEFDTQEMLLNTDSGIVDLTNGNISPFDKKKMLSKNTNTKVSYERPVVFLKFLHDVLKRPSEKETEELIETMQMALGDSLTGRTNKEYLYIMYGHGSNGKSTLVKVISDVLGDYGTSINSALLIQNPNASAQSSEFSMSALLGARFISTSETAADKKLDEVQIKQMTSGEKINAQFKFGNPFSFMPTFSIWMSTNNLPIIRATDFGTWRRIFFFPFLNTFTGDNKDVKMPQKLAAEAPQILGWMIQGAVRLYNEFNGKLPKPKCLEEALSDYKSSMDVIVSYLHSHCTDMAHYKTSAISIYQDYKDWARTNNEWLMSETKFKAEMTKRGYKTERDANDGEMYIGIRLNTDKKGFSFKAMED